MSANPFQTPKTTPDQPPPTSGAGGAGEHVACPQCQTPDPRRLGFTWWGGMVGAKLLTHVECIGCGHRYNGKTGRSNTPAIVAYQAFFFVLAAVVFVLAY